MLPGKQEMLDFEALWEKAYVLLHFATPLLSRGIVPQSIAVFPWMRNFAPTQAVLFRVQSATKGGGNGDTDTLDHLVVSGVDQCSAQYGCRKFLGRGQADHARVRFLQCTDGDVVHRIHHDLAG